MPCATPPIIKALEMEKTSLEFIRDQTLAAQGVIQASLQPMQVATPPGWTVVDIEDAALHRRRIRGSFDTSRLASWLLYVTDQLQRNAGTLIAPQAYVAPDNMRATAIFDLGTATAPGHGSWRASYTAKMTAGYKALLSIASCKAVDQQALVDFFSDWAPNLVFADTTMTPALIVAAVRKVQVARKREVESSVSNLANSGSVMDAVEARSTAGDLPEAFGFAIHPYEGFQQRVFNVQLRLSPGAERPQFYLRIDQHDAVVEDIEAEFVSILSAGLGKVLPIYLGNYSAK